MTVFLAVSIEAQDLETLRQILKEVVNQVDGTKATGKEKIADRDETLLDEGHKQGSFDWMLFEKHEA